MKRSKKYFALLLSFILGQMFVQASASGNEGQIKKHFNVRKFYVPSKTLTEFKLLCASKGPENKTAQTGPFSDQNPKISNFDADKPILINNSSKEIYMMIQERPPQGVCADIKKGYARSSLENDTLKTLDPVTYEEMDVTFMAKGETPNDLLAVNRVPQRLLNELIEFKAKEAPLEYTLTVPWGKTFPYDVRPIEAAFYLPNENYAVAVKNRNTEYWELFFFAQDRESIRFYSGDDSSAEKKPLMPDNPYPETWSDIPEGNTLEALFMYNELFPFEMMNTEEYEKFLERGEYRYFTKEIKKITLEDYPTSGLRSLRTESSLMGLEDLLEEYHDIKAIQTETQSAQDLDSLKLEERNLLRQIFWSSVNRINPGMIFVTDGKGKIYVQSSISPATEVYDQNGQFLKYIYDVSNPKISCLLSKNEYDECDRSSEYNDLKKRLKNMIEDHKSVIDAGSLDSFEKKWQLYDGLAVNSSGKIARTRKTANGRLLELFSPEGDLMLKDIPIEDLQLLSNTGELSDKFYFVRVIDQYPEDYSNQPSYEIFESKLKDEYSMNR